MLLEPAQSHQQRKNVDLATAATAAAAAVGWWLMRNRLREGGGRQSSAKQRTTNQVSRAVAAASVQLVQHHSARLISHLALLYAFVYCNMFVFPTYLPTTAYYILSVVNSYSACLALYC